MDIISSSLPFSRVVVTRHRKKEINFPPVHTVQTEGSTETKEVRKQQHRTFQGFRVQVE